MKIFLEKTKKIEKIISDKKGSFELFAVFLREDTIDKWDIIMTAPWLKKDDMNLLRDIAEIVKGSLNEDLIKLSRIVVLENNHEAVKTIIKSIHVEHGEIEIQNSNFFGLFIKHAHIITSQKVKL